MGCDRVVIASTLSQGNKTAVTWLSYKMTGLESFLITLVQNNTPTTFEAKATDTSLTVDYTAAAGCKATVTPRIASGPSNDNASFAAPVPFPPPPVDPSIKRAVALRVCSDGANVTVNWVSAEITNPDDPPLEGNYISVVQDSTKLTNFPVDDPTATVTTFAYVVQSGSTYEVIVTPFDVVGPRYELAAYPVPIPYP
ncbi:hypothetical protein [Bradyrhizobium sp. SRS-191]|uniref:hypothetical protein n=1 Tax=Bradyrhizobium sp. SRS-191 TaxID=2962606 RepID=UPI00211E2E58|nr:hypothetical protein [Bradyrhizobium sp. SRS-191]